MSKKNTFTMQVSVPVAIDDVAEAAVRGMSRDESANLLVAIDLAIADVGFTEELVVRLMKSLRGDLNSKEYADLIAKLGAIS